MKNTELWPGWRTIDVIGKGGFGKVYKIEKEDASGKYTAALKVLSIPASKEEIEEYRDSGYDDVSITAIYKNQLDDIMREFALLAQFKGQSHIVSYDDHMIVKHADDPGWDILIKMELLDAISKYYRQYAYVEEQIVIKLAKDICKALILCEQQRIIHRDIKPQNIFVNQYGDYKLGDFGIAKTMEHTTHATRIGTYNYMAPEVYQGKPYNATVDIYSLGLVMYWLLNEKRHPFVPMDHVPTSHEINTAQARRLSGEILPVPRHCSSTLWRIIQRACDVEPIKRYSSAADMLDELDALDINTRAETKTELLTDQDETDKTVSLYQNNNNKFNLIQNYNQVNEQLQKTEIVSVSNEPTDTLYITDKGHDAIKSNTKNNADPKGIKKDVSLSVIKPTQRKVSENSKAHSISQQQPTSKEKSQQGTNKSAITSPDRGKSVKEKVKTTKPEKLNQPTSKVKTEQPKEKKSTKKVKLFIIVGVVLLVVCGTFVLTNRIVIDNKYNDLIQQRNYEEAIRVKGNNSEAYRLLIEQYIYENKFSDEQSKKIEALFNENQSKFSQSSEDYLDLNYQIGCAYLFSFTDADGEIAFNTGIQKAKKYFENIVGEDGVQHQNYKNYGAAKSLHSLCKFYAKYQSENVNEPTKDDLEGFLASANDSPSVMSEYAKTSKGDTVYTRLALYSGLMNLINSKINAFYSKGVAKGTVFGVVDNIVSKTNEVTEASQMRSVNLISEIKSMAGVIKATMNSMYNN